MRKLRYIFQNIIFIPVVICSSIICALLVIIVSLFSKKTPLLKKIEYIWSKSIVWASGCNIISDMPSLDRGKFYVFVSNHFSHLDTPVIRAILKDFAPRFVAKKSLFKIPIFGWGMEAVGHIPIDRANKRQALKDLNRAVDIIKQGESVLLFPEGTRNTNDKELMQFQIGAFILAIKLGLEMVPVIIYGTQRALPRGSIFVRPSDIYIKVCEPVKWPQEFSIKERDKLKDKTRVYMQNKYVELIKCINKKIV